MPIILELPRSSKGQEILDAFRDAATFRASPICKWEAHSTVATRHGKATAAETFVSKRGYCATPAYLHRQNRVSRLFWGKRDVTWKTLRGMKEKFETQIVLQPLYPGDTYKEVVIELTHEYESSIAGQKRIAETPDHPQFEQHREAYDRIIREFLKRLA